MKNIVAGIDIGTSKVCTVIGGLDENRDLKILGEGTARCSGMKKGVIIDIDEVAFAIKNSVRDAQEKAKTRIVSAYTNINGMNVEIIKRNVGIDLESESGKIKAEDVYRLNHLASNISIPYDKKIIDIIVDKYVLDETDEIINPIGLAGEKLELYAQVVLGNVAAVDNITSCFEKAEIKLDGFVIGALAETGMNLTAEEKENGVIYINTGAGVTDISIIENNSLLFYDSVPLGGDHISNDLSIILKTSFNEGDRIKKHYQMALTSCIQEDKDIVLTGQDLFSQNTVKLSEIVEIIEARVIEILSMSKELIDKAEITINENWTLILSGEGISPLIGASEIAENIFGRIAIIKRAKSNDKIDLSYNTAAGIVKYISELKKSKKTEIITVRGTRSKRKRSFMQKIKELFKKEK